MSHLTPFTLIILLLLLTSCAEWQVTRYRWPNGDPIAAKRDWSSGSRLTPKGVVVSQWDCLGWGDHVCDWIYWHEMAHAVLGHSSLGVKDREAELAADCWAVREFIHHGGSRREVVDVVWWLRGRSGPGHHHPPAWRRAARVMECSSGG